MNRRTTRLACPLAVGVLALGLSGCTHSGATAPEPKTASTNPATKPEANRPAVEYDITWADATPVIYAEATDKFGAKGVKAAIEVAKDAVRTYGWNDDLSAARPPEHEDLLKRATSLMTADAAADWRSVTTDFVSGSKKERDDAANDVGALAFYAIWRDGEGDWRGKPIGLAEERPFVTNPEFEGVTAWISDDDPARRLAIQVKSAADLRVLHDGEPKTMHLTRKATFWMVREPGGWKIDGWWGVFTSPERLTAEETP